MLNPFASLSPNARAMLDELHRLGAIAGGAPTELDIRDIGYEGEDAVNELARIDLVTVERHEPRLLVWLADALERN